MHNILKYPITLLAVIISFTSQAEGVKHSVPFKLFGIELGKAYEIGYDPITKGDMPIKKFTGANQFLSPYGIHYYFHPLKEYEACKYIEKKESPDDKYYRTSLHIYLLPIVDKNIKSLKELEGNPPTKWEVIRIDWSGGSDKEDGKEVDTKNYYWAKDMCETFKAGINKDPEIFDHYEAKYYTCKFIESDRVFEIYTTLRTVSLSFNREKADLKEKAVESYFRKIRAEDIRPY